MRTTSIDRLACSCSSSRPVRREDCWRLMNGEVMCGNGDLEHVRLGVDEAEVLGWKFL